MRQGPREQKIFVLRQKQEVGVDEPLGDARVRGASPAESDHMINVMAVVSQAMNEGKRKILVEENVHDAWRTAGGRWAATCAA